MQNCSIDEHIVKRVGNGTYDKENSDFSCTNTPSESTSKFEITCDADCLADVTDDQLKAPEKSHKKKEKLQWAYLARSEPPKKLSTVQSFPIIEVRECSIQCVAS